MKIATPPRQGEEKIIYEIDTTIETLKSVAKVEHTIGTMAQELKVSCEISGSYETPEEFIAVIDCIFMNGSIMVMDECTGKFERA